MKILMALMVSILLLAQTRIISSEKLPEINKGTINILCIDGYKYVLLKNHWSNEIKLNQMYERGGVMRARPMGCKDKK